MEARARRDDRAPDELTGGRAMARRSAFDGARRFGEVVVRTWHEPVRGDPAAQHDAARERALDLGPAALPLLDLGGERRSARELDVEQGSAAWRVVQLHLFPGDLRRPWL